MNIHCIGVTSDPSVILCVLYWPFALHLRSCYPCNIQYMPVLCIMLIKLSICLYSNVTYTMYIVHLAIKGILICIAIVSPWQVQAPRLSNIVGYIELDCHSLLLLVLYYSASLCLDINMLLNQMVAWIKMFNLSPAWGNIWLTFSPFSLWTQPLDIHFVSVLGIKGQSLCLGLSKKCKNKAGVYAESLVWR